MKVTISTDTRPATGEVREAVFRLPLPDTGVRELLRVDVFAGIPEDNPQGWTPYEAYAYLSITGVRDGMHWTTSSLNRERAGQLAEALHRAAGILRLFAKGEAPGYIAEVEAEVNKATEVTS